MSPPLLSPPSPRFADWKRDVTPWVERLDDAKRAILRDTLARHDGNRSRAARELGLQRTYMQRLIRELLLPERRTTA